MTYLVTNGAVENAASHLHSSLLRPLAEKKPSNNVITVYGIPRGGIPAAYALQVAGLKGRQQHRVIYEMVDTPLTADLILDDLIDSGITMNRYMVDCPNKTYAALFSKAQESRGRVFIGPVLPDTWLVFPWEGNAENSAADIPTRLLQFIGEDPAREGLRETPARFLKAWGEWTSGYSQDPAEVLKTFEDGSNGYDEMVLVRDIPVYSQCEHHLAPFFGKAHVAYIPNGKIAGLSKLSRLVDVFSRRLQVQERLTVQIADAMQEHLSPRGVGVVIECRHLCMESRGIERSGATTVTSAMRGALMDKPEARAELLSLIRR